MVGVCMATTLIVVTGVLCMWSELVWAVLCVMVICFTGEDVCPELACI